MRYELVLTGKFKSGLKTAKKRGLNISLLEDIVERLYKKFLWKQKIETMLLVEPIKGIENVIFSQIGY